MSMDPNQISQMLAMYKQMYPNGLPSTPQAQAYSQAQAPMAAAKALGNAPAGTNTTAGGVNALSKLMLALMQRKRMQDYMSQYPQQGTTAMGGASTPAPMTPGGAGDSGTGPG